MKLLCLLLLLAGCQQPERVNTVPVEHKDEDRPYYDGKRMA